MIYGEFIPGLDGKMRYFKPLRIELYQKVVAAIKSLAPNVIIYFCMEDDEVGKNHWDLFQMSAVVWRQCWTRAPLTNAIYHHENLKIGIK
jgi:hypothetical protein